VFQTEQREDVEAFCASNDIQDDVVLKTLQINPGVVHHPGREEDFLFNQAHLFHPSAPGEEMLAFMWRSLTRICCRATPSTTMGGDRARNLASGPRRIECRLPWIFTDGPATSP
jgi:hypothetical protein